MHTIVRVSEKAEEKGRSTEERLQFLEDKLAKMSQALEEMRELIKSRTVSVGQGVAVNAEAEVTAVEKP